MNNMYEFEIKLRNVFGGLSASGKTEAEATEKIMDLVSSRLAAAFPELNIEYDVECVAMWEGGDPDEAYDLEVNRELGVI